MRAIWGIKVRQKDCIVLMLEGRSAPATIQNYCTSTVVGVASCCCAPHAHAVRQTRQDSRI